MTLEEFKDFVKTGKTLDTEDIHQFMDKMSGEARKITFRLNTAYHTSEEIRDILSELFGKAVPSTLRVFPPFYTDFGKNIEVGEGVFINACCHFQDHGGVRIGDGCQIGHNVVFATLNHFLEPEKRKMTYSAPIVLGKGRLQRHHPARLDHWRQCRDRCRSGRNERCSCQCGGCRCSSKGCQTYIINRK